MFKISISQMNCNTGGIIQNCTKIMNVYENAVSYDSDIIIYPHNAIFGFNTKALQYNKSFIANVNNALNSLKGLTNDKKTKMLLGNLNGKTIVIGDDSITEYEQDATIVFENQVQFIFNTGNRIDESKIIIHIDNHPKPYLKHSIHTGIIKTKYAQIQVNQVGAEDDKVFAGSSHITSASGECILRLSQWEEDIGTACIAENGFLTNHETQPVAPLNHTLQDYESLYMALVISLRNYVNKNNFNGIIIGLSGGIDSALTLIIAVDAVGNNKVTSVLMPSIYTSEVSVNDAIEISNRLMVKYHIIPITTILETLQQSLEIVFSTQPQEIVEENMQPRIRSLILMSISNKYHYLLVATGNKSEAAMGYTTLYGDTCGGYAVLKDIYKTEVYQLSKWRNQNAICSGIDNPIPANILEKAPSAELKHNQCDQDSLPPYETIDYIVSEVMENEKPIEVLVQQGYKNDVIEHVLKLFSRSQYKRSQSPIGPIFSKGLPMYPITNNSIKR